MPPIRSSTPRACSMPRPRDTDDNRPTDSLAGSTDTCQWPTGGVEYRDIRARNHRCHAHSVADRLRNGRVVPAIGVAARDALEGDGGGAVVVFPELGDDRVAGRGIDLDG